ncbi:hypothetical protein ONS96_002200 [Cadophora gregata f. sp. sojae]|nr:hypothetical protein ONS96_002200 [Cadophora gregata f. sp. sojae]
MWNLVGRGRSEERESNDQDQSIRMAPSASSRTITPPSCSSVFCFDFLPEGISSPRASAADRFTAEPLPFERVTEEPLLFKEEPFVASSVLGFGVFFLRGMGDVGASSLVSLVMSKLLIGLSSAVVL